MKKIAQIIFTFIIAALYLNSYAASDYKACETMSDIMVVIAEKRDKGESKKEIKEFFKKINNKLPNEFDAYLDAIFYRTDISPHRVKKLFLDSCYEEYGLR